MSPNLRSSGNVFWSNELLKMVVSNGAKKSSFSFSIRGGILSIVDAFFVFSLDNSSLTACIVIGWNSKNVPWFTLSLILPMLG